MAAEMDRRGWVEEEFQRTLWNPDAWWDKADDLLRAADELRPTVERYWQAHIAGHAPDKRLHDTHGTYFMLVGFAVENLCKAALVHSERATTADRSNGKLPSFLKRHDLMDLLRDIGVTVSGSVERRVVERVTRAVLWSGRYPVPVEASDLTKGRRIGLLIDFYCADDLNDLRQLVDFTRRHVAKIIGQERCRCQ